MSGRICARWNTIRLRKSTVSLSLSYFPVYSEEATILFRFQSRFWARLFMQHSFLPYTSHTKLLLIYFYSISHFPMYHIMMRLNESPVIFLHQFAWNSIVSFRVSVFLWMTQLFIICFWSNRQKFAVHYILRTIQWNQCFPQRTHPASIARQTVNCI